MKTLNGTFNCAARGKLRREGEIFVGDMVEITATTQGKGVIDAVLPRRNKLTRPYVSNIDMLCIVIAPLPEPDLYLTDKLLAGCIQQNIEAIVCVNKSDLADAELIKSIKNDYNGIADVLEVSAVTGQNMDALVNKLHGIVCLAGQSAVGKSSIINTLLGSSLKIGDISEKSKRGRHTTRQVEIIDGNGFQIVDTCGFSSLEIPLLEPKEIITLFVDFEQFAEGCKFRGCSHIGEQECAVKEAVEQGKLTKERYDRYKALYEQAKENWRKRYE